MTTTDTDTNGTLQALLNAQRPLWALYDHWIESGKLNLEAFEHAHDVATVAAHQHYREHVPAYAELAANLGLFDADDPVTISSQLGSTEDLFKSYRAEWVDAGDFVSMTRWIEGISSIRVNADLDAVSTVEDWITALAANGVVVRYSSGTSGHLSLVPRDRLADNTIAQLSFKQFFATTQRLGLDFPRFDGVMLTFRGGNQALSFLAEMLGKSCGNQTFLFDFRMNADLLRAVIRNVVSVAQRPQFDAFRRETVERLSEQYDRVLTALKASQRAGRPALILGGPGQIFEVCSMLEQRGEALQLPSMSVILLTGGWKSFKGVRVPRNEFGKKIAACLGILPDRIREAYGMTECSVQSNRCPHGRFHIPPAIRPSVLDDALYPIPKLGTGRLAFADPFATCFPGFFISGDEVNLTLDPCPCGREGYSIVGEVRRAPGQEARGCGGVMTAVQA